ncbi:MAG: hypothetical protein WC291_03150 [Thermodesulfovibrionales bacterium]|jgi:hypothetical protein
MATLQKMNLLKFALLSIMFLGGCSANHYSIHREDHLDSDESMVIAVDAKQRLLLSNVITRTTEARSTTDPAAAKLLTTEKIRRYCAEPSPDVFSVLSQAASGGGSFGQTANSMNIALQAAFSSSEAGSTIPRTQTINMLKEMMYRTCESYLNGQISDFEYPIIAARDQRIMTSILAIEQLTGVILPKPVVIAATGSASTGQSTNDAIVRLDDANKKVAEKKNALEIAQKEFSEIDQPKGSCDVLVNKASGELTADEKTKLQKCTEKKNNLTKAEKDLTDAKDLYDAIMNLAGKPGDSSAITSATLPSPSPATEIDKQIEEARSQTIEGVANVVRDIVSMSFRQEDETSFFCYRALDQKMSNVYDSCLNFISAKVENEAARLERETHDTREKLDASKKQLFDKFWEKIKKDSDQVVPEKVAILIDKAFPASASIPMPLRNKLDRMKQRAEKKKIWAIFRTIESWAIDELLKD